MTMTAHSEFLKPQNLVGISSLKPQKQNGRSEVKCCLLVKEVGTSKLVLFYGQLIRDKKSVSRHGGT